MGRPQKKSKNKRKGNRHQQTNNGHHSRHQEQEEPAVSFDPDPPVAGDDGSGSASESDDDSLVFDTVRVPEVALNCAIQAIQLGAVGLKAHMPPPPPPPRRPAPPPNDEESHLSLLRYLSRKPGRRSRIRKGVPLNHIEPLVSYNRKMARVAPRATLRTPMAQLNRERAAILCPCNQLEESQIRSIRAVQMFMRSPRFFRLMQFSQAIANRFSAYRLQRENQIGVQPVRNGEPQRSNGEQQGTVSNAQNVNGNSRVSNVDAQVVSEDQKVENGVQLNGESSVRQNNRTLEESTLDNVTNADQANEAQKTKEITKNGSFSEDDDASRSHKKE